MQGYYTFGITGTKEERPLWSISIASTVTADALIEGNTYTLKEREDGNQWGGIYFVYSWNDDYMRYTDNMNYKGEMTITKLDVQKQIISGTFWSDVQNPKTDETVKVRDGRFDVIANF